MYVSTHASNWWNSNREKNCPIISQITRPPLAGWIWMYTNQSDIGFCPEKRIVRFASQFMTWYSVSVREIQIIQIFGVLAKAIM
jgi:hypothetical protein